MLPGTGANLLFASFLGRFPNLSRVRWPVRVIDHDAEIEATPLLRRRPRE
jgi:hypothetical protein